MLVRPAPLYPRAVFYFLLILATALVGFWPSYFSRLTQTDFAHHFHGITATAWLLLLITQAWLMRQRKMQWHRRLGRASIVLALLFVASGLAIVHTMLAQPSGLMRVYGHRLAFVDLLTLAWFIAAYALAIVHRRNTPLHARYMASTALLVFPPALARVLPQLLSVGSFDAAFHLAFVVTEVLILLLIAHDLREGKLRRPYVQLLGVTLLQQGAFLVIPGIAWWQDVCIWIARL